MVCNEINEICIGLTATLDERVTIDYAKTVCRLDIIGAEVFFDVVPEGNETPCYAREGVIQSEQDLTVVIKHKNGYCNRKKSEVFIKEIARR